MKNNLQKRVAGGLRYAGLSVLALAGLVTPVQAQMDEGLRITYDMEGAILSFLRDGGGVVQVDGLDVPGLVMYRPATKTVYYQNPAWPKWLAVGPEAFEAIPDRVEAVAGAAWAPFMDKPVRRWDIRVPEEACGSWFGSPGVGAVLGMDAADFMRILGVVNWLNGGQHIACHVMMPGPADQKTLGWPVRWQTEHGTWQLKEVVRVPLSDFVLPADMQPVTDEARLALMMTQLTTEERKVFMTQGRGLPLMAQLKLLEEVLAEGAE